MSAQVSPLAGKPAPASMLADIDKLLGAYADRRPNAHDPSQRVAFGTSGHRGSSLDGSFNEWHILAITQAICDHRAGQGIDGPLFLGIDTHALSQPAMQSALEVLAANGVMALIAAHGEFTPTPAISHAILAHNHGRERDLALADGIVVTPSHNPPDNGGFKYNPTDGGPADTTVTSWIERRANGYLERQLAGVKRIPYARARRTDNVREHGFLGAYVSDLGNAIDFDAIRGAGLKLGVDPLGGAGVRYWAPIAEHYKIDMAVISEEVDPRFAFMTLDWDGRIRMDPSSPYAMQRLLSLKDKYDVAFACDTDYDRHGIVARSAGLLPSNHYLAVMIDYLFRRRADWPLTAAIGKTVVSSGMIDKVAAKLKRGVHEVPVGFKWYAQGLLSGALGFGGEESAGASFLRRDGSVWTTDKDGIVAALLSAEITAREDRDPGECYRRLEEACGACFADRIDAPADAAQKRELAQLEPDALKLDSLAGEAVLRVIDKAPGNDAPIGGIKVIAEHGWFAARPSGTEDIYKIYAESFRSLEHLKSIIADAQRVVDAMIGKQ